MIIDSQLPWTTEDEAHWDAFLQSDTGRRLLPKLAESAPVLFDGGDVNKILIRSGELRGCQGMLQRLLDLSHAAPLPPSSDATQYPPLEKDEHWNDGQKLKE